MADHYELPIEHIAELRANDFSEIHLDGAPWAEGLDPDIAVRDALPYMEARWAWHVANCPAPNEDQGGALVPDCRDECGVHWSEIVWRGPAPYVDALAESMLSQGWCGDPVEISSDYDRLEDGHHRALAAIAAGLESVPVLDLDA